MHLNLLNAIDTVSIIEKNRMANFVIANSECSDHGLVLQSIEYALNDYITQGGFVIQILDKPMGDLIGVAITNKTGISGYFPENLLVYLVVKDNDSELENILFDEVLKFSKGDVILNASINKCATTAIKKGFKEKYEILTYSK